MPEESSETQIESGDVADFWQRGELWFQDFIPAEVPWGTDRLLPKVPDSICDRFGVIVGGVVEVDGIRHDAGDTVLARDLEEVIEIAKLKGASPSGFLVPWYDRIVPMDWLVPHRRVIDLQHYRESLKPVLRRSLLFTVLPLLVGFYRTEFLMLSLLFATFYGIFPLIQSGMSWLTRVDRYSIEELNRRMIGNELFSIWIEKRPAGSLIAGIVVLAVIFLVQMAVGLGESIEQAALVKTAVIQGGEWWRTITTGLMHGSPLHIIFNGMALYSLGRVVVALSSPALLNIVFFLTVITGSLASLWLGPGEASVGASGGILGCLGFLLVVSQKFRRQLPTYLRSSLIQSTIVITIFGLIGSSFIDNAAHAGGFLGGILIGIVCYPRLRLAPEKTSLPIRLLSYLCLAGMVAGVGKVIWELFPYL